jgi:uncharacterized protein YhbP (UPF0306 family)
MAPRARLTETEKQQVAAYLKAYAKKWPIAAFTNAFSWEISGRNLRSIDRAGLNFLV